MPGLELVIADPAKNTADYLLQEALRQHERLQHDRSSHRMSEET